MKIRVNQVRHFTIESVVNRAEAETSSFITLSLSSETPVRRDYGDEILLHGPENIDMSRATPNGLPLLVSHNDLQLPIGRLKNLRLEDKRLLGDAYFSGRPEAQAVRQDVLDGIVTDTSVNYRILDYKVVKAPTASDVNQVFITRWCPREGSMVACGADHTVGAGRSDTADLEMELDLERSQPVLNAESQAGDGVPVLGAKPEDGTCPTCKKDQPDCTCEKRDDDEERDDEERASYESDQETCPECNKPKTECECEDSATAEDRSEKRAASELLHEELQALRTVALTMQFRSEAEIDAILATTQDLDAKRAILLKPQTVTFTKDNQMDPNQLFTLSLANALRGDFAKVDETMKGSFTQTGERSFTADLFNTSGSRANEMTTAAKGNNTIYEQNIGFLDLLRARAAVLKAGGRTRQGQGSLSYIRLKTATVATLRGENTGTTTNTFADFEKVNYIPKALTAKVYLTDELQKETLLDLQNVLRGDMIKQFALAIDSYSLNGAASPVITGILSAASGIYSDVSTIALPTFTKVNNLKALVDAKSVDLESCAYLLTPSLLAVLETTQKFTNGSVAICDGNKVNGYAAYSSSNVPVSTVNHTAAFGDFSNLEVCLQGATEFMIDITTRFDEGITILTARQYFDVGILQPSAFAKTQFLVA
jgi:HK97 family phage major capsid protein